MSTRTVILVAIVSALISGITLASPLLAQQPAGAQDATARAVAANVQSFYDQTTSVSAAFFQTYVNKLYQRTDRSKGRVVFKKPGKMRWNYDSPNGKVIASDGHKLTVFEPGDAAEPGQVFEQSIADSQLPQALSFLMGTGRLENDFTFRLLDAAKEGFANGDVLELRPRVESPHYERILFYVERDPRLRGLVRRVLIIDPNGNRNRFDFSAFEFNRAAADDQFRFQPPSGTRHVSP
jgi:outer membrane lipoprotein carrier protein